MLRFTTKTMALTALALSCLLYAEPTSSLASATQHTPIPSSWTASEAVRFALAENPDAAIAQRRIESAESTMTLAAAADLPQVSLSTGYSQTNNPMYSFGNILNQGAFEQNMDFNNPGRTDDLLLKAQISYRLYNGGRDQAEKQSADINRTLSENSLALIHQQLGFEVVKSFQTILQATNMIQVRKEALEAIKAALEVGTARYEAGDLLRQDLLNLELQKSEASENLIQSRHQLELAKRAFLGLLGLEGGDVNVVTDTDLHQAIPEKIDIGTRLELKDITMQERLAEADLKKAQAGYLPTVDAFASYQADNGFETEEQGNSWMAGIKMDYALFDGRQTSSKVAMAKTRLRELAAQKHKAEIALNLEVQRARLDFEQAKERVTVTEKMVSVAIEATRLSRARFKEGLILSSDLIDYETRLSDAQARNLTAKAAYQVAIANLRRAAGLEQFPN